MKRWVDHLKVDENLVSNLSKEINISPFLARILIQRGIDSFTKAKDFFRPSLEKLHDPYLMKDMDKAVQAITQRIASKAAILVYGDYDVDGTTSVASLYSFLKELGCNVEYYIPDRYDEGYGVSKKGINYAIENEISLIVSLDCGIRAVENIAYAKENGIDFVVCDHHLPGENLPGAIAILDPKQNGCPYPYKELSGCGVGFKLIQAVASYYNLEFSQIQPYLDLLAVSIAADIVPITGENRIMMYHGLKCLEESPRLGLKTLMKYSGLNGSIDVNGVVFGIAPRINAAGRIRHAKLAVKLLISNDETEASTLGDEINSLNDERRSLDELTTQEALDMLSSNEANTLLRSTVVYKENWHKGVVGIVASRLIENYYRPTIVLAEESGVATGSARSVGNFNIIEAIDSCGDLLSKYGGHKHAAGLTLPIENITSFVDRFENFVASRIKEEELKPSIKINSGLKLEQITPGFVSIIEQMKPFGPGNMSPVFKSEHVFCTNAVGLGNKHLKLQIKLDSGKTLEAIGFGMISHLNNISSTTPLSIAYSVGINEYKGIRSIQLNLKDLKIDN